MADTNTSNYFYNLPVELQTRIFALKQLAEQKDHDAWKYHLVKHMDDYLLLQHSNVKDNLPYGFRFNYDEDRQLCGWYWNTTGRPYGVDTELQPFIGADAIASFQLIKAHESVMEEYEGDEVWEGDEVTGDDDLVLAVDDLALADEA